MCDTADVFAGLRGRRCGRIQHVDDLLCAEDRRITCSYFYLISISFLLAHPEYSPRRAHLGEGGHFLCRDLESLTLERLTSQCQQLPTLTSEAEVQTRALRGSTMCSLTCHSLQISMQYDYKKRDCYTELATTS